MAVLLNDYYGKIDQLDSLFIGQQEQNELQQDKLNKTVRELRAFKINQKLSEDKYAH